MKKEKKCTRGKKTVKHCPFHKEQNKVAIHNTTFSRRYRSTVYFIYYCNSITSTEIHSQMHGHFIIKSKRKSNWSVAQIAFCNAEKISSNVPWA